MIETKADVTDGPDDKQIDAIVVDDDSNTIYIVQGKFMSDGSVDAEPLREVLASWIQLKDIVAARDRQPEAKQRLRSGRHSLEKTSGRV
jgi:hypothetical protein